MIDHHIEAALALRDSDVLICLPVMEKKFNILINAIIEVEECKAIYIVLIPPNNILYQHRAEV